MEDKKNSNTAETMTAQSASTTAVRATTTPGAESTSTTATGQAIQNALTRATLPKGYLADGSMMDADGIMRAEYVGEYAEALAQLLKPMKASAFRGAFLREAKELRKKRTPYGAQKNCAIGMVAEARKLVYRKKEPAPGVLLEMITAVTATVTSPATFDVLYKHLDSIYSNMLE